MGAGVQIEGSEIEMAVTRGNHDFSSSFIIQRYDSRTYHRATASKIVGPPIFTSSPIRRLIELFGKEGAVVRVAQGNRRNFELDMEAQGNGTDPPVIENQAVRLEAPIVANSAEPAIASTTIANLAVPATAPVIARVVGPTTALHVGNLAGADGFDICGGLGVSHPPLKSDMRYKIWQNL